MRRGFVHVFIAAVVLTTACSKSENTRSNPGTTPPSTAPASADFKAAASALVDDLSAGRYTEVETHFDAMLKAQLPTSQLENAWRIYQEAEGAYASHGPPVAVKKGLITVEQVPITTSSGTGEVRVSYHPDGTVAGLYFLKAGAPAP